MRRAFVALSLVLVSATLASAQGKPNFTGKWALAAPNAAEVGMNPTSMTVTQDDKTITLLSTGQMGEIKTIFNLDGTQAKSPIEVQGMTIDRVTKSTWDGNKLVLTTVSDFQGQTFETKQIWSLGTDGALTVDATRPDFQGGGAPITSKLVYKKQ
jgi:hypothetical protein